MSDIADRLAFAWSRISHLYQVPDWDGRPGYGLSALTGAPAPKQWHAIASAHAPVLRGDEIRFAVAEDGQAYVEAGVAPDARAPLTAELEEQIDAPYCAVAVRNEDDVWTAAADPAEVVELELDAEVVELSRIAGEISAPSTRALTACLCANWSDYWMKTTAM